jgi:hypothetical protein
MGTELALPQQSNPARLPSWPAWLQQRSDAVANAVQADQEGQHREMPTLPANLILNSVERRMVEAHRTELTQFLDLDRPITLREQMLTNDQAHGVMIAGLLIKGGGIKLDKAASDQLTEDYLDAIEDLPAWAVREALRKWNRAESPRIDPKKPHDFNWRPQPPTLRQLTYLELWNVRSRIQQLEKVLNAVPLIEYSEEHCAEMRAKLGELATTLSPMPTREAAE